MLLLHALPWLPDANDLQHLSLRRCCANCGPALQVLRTSRTVAALTLALLFFFAVFGVFIAIFSSL